MSISAETKKKIDQFAKEQAAYYLEDAELSYLEKLRKKGALTKEKVARKLDRFRNSTGRSHDAQGELILYVTDSMADLMAEGLSEQDALEKAKERLAFRNENTYTDALKDKYRAYYMEMPLGVQEAIGLLYGAMVILGAVLGGVAGFFLGTYVFSYPLWASILVSAAVGVGLGLPVAMLKNASIIRKAGR